MLGLSATMQRKDGLTRVFKMFLGEIIYKEKRDAGDEVLVKAIEYITKDDEFNEMKYDYRGNPAYSTMISKLCSYNHRSEFILSVIQNELEIYPDQQIMILAQNKNVLVYLHKAIEHRNIASVGFYIGGMKKEALKCSETKKVIIATYAMAAEALDIKSLTTLILATPRTDITQAVGRILRVKHKRPMVIDIIDSHIVFKKQWLKRKKFYEKNKYKTIYATSNDYTLDKWETLYDPLYKKITVKADKSLPKGKCMIKI
jgi:superfamily II DNA or RNA helicase